MHCADAAVAEAAAAGGAAHMLYILRKKLGPGTWGVWVLETHLKQETKTFFVLPSSFPSLIFLLMAPF